MKRVLTAVVLVPLVLLVVFRAPLWLFALVVAGIVVLALREYLNISESAGIQPFRRLTHAAAVLAIYVFWITSYYRAMLAYFPRSRELWWVSFVLLPVFFGTALVFRKDLNRGLAAASSGLFGVFYIAASLGLLLELRAKPSLNILILFVLFSVWAGDIAAYYIGKNFGRHRLAPIVSPNKSWEGAVASVIASVVVAAIVFRFDHQLERLFSAQGFYGDSFAGRIAATHIIVLGILTNIAAQLGDLFESALKRGAGVKDSGTLLPGHGGILDRIDALLFAIPVAWYYANLTGFLQ